MHNSYVILTTVCVSIDCVLNLLVEIPVVFLDITTVLLDTTTALVDITGTDSEATYRDVKITTGYMNVMIEFSTLHEILGWMQRNFQIPAVVASLDCIFPENQATAVWVILCI